MLPRVARSLLAKLLPRSSRNLDGAANGSLPPRMYEGDGGRRHWARFGRRVMIVCNDATVKGGTYIR